MLLLTQQITLNGFQIKNHIKNDEHACRDESDYKTTRVSDSKQFKMRIKAKTRSKFSNSNQFLIIADNETTT